MVRADDAAMIPGLIQVPMRVLKLSWDAHQSPAWWSRYELVHICANRSFTWLGMSVVQFHVIDAMWLCRS